MYLYSSLHHSNFLPIKPFRVALTLPVLDMRTKNPRKRPLRAFNAKKSCSGGTFAVMSVGTPFVSSLVPLKAPP